jgi:hypothetical protein
VIVRPLFRSLSRPLFRALTGLVSAITKVLIDLSPTSSSFYSLGTDSVLTTAYKLGISTVLPTASTTYALYGRASSATDYFKILSTGYLSLDVNGTVVTSTVLATKDSQYREYSVTLDGNDFVFKENDTVISTVTNATAAAKTLTLNLIGNSNGAEFYLGVLADPVMGSLAFKLNKLTDNFELPVANVFGSQEVSNNTFDNTTGWSSPRLSSAISVVNNKLRSTADGTNTFGSAIALTGLVIGKLYSFKASATCNNPSANMRLRIATDSNLGSAIVDTASTSSVSVDTHFIATATTLYAGTITTGQNSGDHVDIDAGISIQSITNLLTYQNIGTGRSFRETYTLIDDDYFGSERIVGGNFLTPSDWSTAGESTVAGGRANIFSTTGSNTYVLQSDVLDEDKFFRVIYDVFSYTSGVLKIPAVSSQSVSSDVGTTTIDFIALGTSILLQRASVEPTDIVIDSISIKRYIEVA